MKKISILFLTILFAVTLIGCNNKDLEETKDTVITKTCTEKNDGVEQKYEWTATNDKIESVVLTITYDNSIFDVDSLSSLDDTTKVQMQTNMLTALGLENASYKGMKINIDIQDQMIIKINADLTTANTKVLKKVGLDYSKTDMSLENTVKVWQKNGATCN